MEYILSLPDVHMITYVLGTKFWLIIFFRLLWTFWSFQIHCFYYAIYMACAKFSSKEKKPFQLCIHSPVFKMSVMNFWSWLISFGFVLISLDLNIFLSRCILWPTSDLCISSFSFLQLEYTSLTESKDWILRLRVSSATSTIKFKSKPWFIPVFISVFRNTGLPIDCFPDVVVSWSCD